MGMVWFDLKKAVRCIAPKAPAFDDLDPVYGLHDYSLMLEIKGGRGRDTIYEQYFRGLDCVMEDRHPATAAHGGNRDTRYAEVRVMRQDEDKDHETINSTEVPHLRWGVGTISGKLDTCWSIGLALFDEHGTVFTLCVYI